MKALQALGLSKYERAVYLALVQLGKTTAQALSEASKVPITAVYPNLKTLAQKGLVQKLAGDPSYFEALDAKIALHTLADRESENLMKASAEAVERLEQLERRERPEPQDIVELSYGFHASHQLLGELCARSQKSLHIVGWRFQTSKSKYEVLGFLREAIKNGAQVKLILTDKRPRLKQAVRNFKDAGVDIRFYPLHNFSIIVRDKKECKITLKNPGLENKLNLHITDADLCAALDDYFLGLWKKSKRSF